MQLGTVFHKPQPIAWTAATGNSAAAREAYQLK
jgi:hypothetical protein